MLFAYANPCKEKEGKKEEMKIYINVFNYYPEHMSIWYLFIFLLHGLETWKITFLQFNDIYFKIPTYGLWNYIFKFSVLFYQIEKENFV